jgi:hypothetical protein
MAAAQLLTVQVPTTVSAFVSTTTTVVTAATTQQRLYAIDPTKEIGVLAPVGFFEYVLL